MAEIPNCWIGLRPQTQARFKAPFYGCMVRFQEAFWLARLSPSHTDDSNILLGETNGGGKWIYWCRIKFTDKAAIHWADLDGDMDQVKCVPRDGILHELSRLCKLKIENADACREGSEIQLRCSGFVVIDDKDQLFGCTVCIQEDDAAEDSMVRWRVAKVMLKTSRLLPVKQRQPGALSLLAQRLGF
eukprot:scpid91137/ scgid26214/ 